MMRRRLVRAKGARQRIWDVLRRAKVGLLTKQVEDRAECRHNTAEVYLYGLKKHGYLAMDNGLWSLKLNTGPIAPSYTTRSNTILDLNLTPPMSGAELEAIWRKTGLSLNQFALELGLGPGMSTRLRAMMNGSKNVGPSVESAVNTHYPTKS